MDGIQAREYQVTPSALGLQSPNRNQNLRTYFRSEGIEVVPRTAAGTDWRWGWRTTRWGRPDLLTAASGTAPVPDAARVEYPRGPLTEWYQNDPKGIEQGFSLHSRPAGKGQLLIEGTLSGTLEPLIADAGRALEFRTPEGCRVLRYDGLTVVDARGRELPSSLNLADAAITIRIDDTDAVYPVLVDPILTTPDWTGNGEHPSARFGQVVSTAGDVNGDGYSDVVISAPGYDSGGLGNNGRVFAFYGSASGLPDVADWYKSGDQVNGFFGQALGAAGDVNGDGFDEVIVGACNYTHGESFEGRAWLYYGSADGLLESWDWSVEGNQINAFCGTAVGTAGDVNNDGYADVFVTLEGYDNGQSNEGIVWVYHGAAGGLATTPSWTGEVDKVNASFGYSAAAAGDVNGDRYGDLLVGALHYPNASGKIGCACVFYGSAGGLGHTPWISEPSTTSEYYAWAVAGAGDVNGDGYADILVGAPNYSGDIGGEGRAYLYAGAAAGPSTTPAWTTEGSQSGSSYGIAVGTAGDVNGDGCADVLVGAEDYDGGDSEEGKAYLYMGRLTGLSDVAIWSVEGDQFEAHCGSSVGTAGDVDGDGRSEILIGSPDYDDGEDNEGRACLYAGSSDAPQTVAGWWSQTNQAYARGGDAIASAGDVNGDGFSDVLIGSSSYDNGEEDEGVAFLFLGGPQGLGSVATWYAEGNQVQAYLGSSVGSAGDVNGDGLADILVGAPWYDGAIVDEGAAFVWHSQTEPAPPGNPANASWSAFSGQGGSSFGFSTASAGDVNGDGFGDIIVGAYELDAGQVDEGAAFVYHGSATGLSETEDWYRDADLADAYFGYCVESAGDFNGDGYGDVIVGAYKYDHPTLDEGLASVYHGSSSGLTNGAPFWYAQGDEAEGWLGFSVGCAGDVNADGYSDIIIGAPQISAPADDGGKALVWFGGPTAPPNGTPSNADWAIGRNRVGARLGWCVGSAGDVNSDGYSDILVSTPYPGGLGDAWGIVWLWLGASTGIPSIAADWYVEGIAEYTGFATECAAVGDINGDGFGDVMIGAPYYDGGQYDEGAIFLYHGNRGRGLSRAPQQWQTDYADPIALLGWSEEESRFALRGIARTAAGRGTVRMVWEVKEFQTAFDGTDVGRTAWTNTGAPSDPGGSRVVLSRIVSGLTPGRLHHWRMRFEARNPFFPRTPWVSLPGNGSGEADLRMGVATDAPDLAQTGTGLRFESISPNPEPGYAVIRINLPEAGNARLTLHDVSGRRVATLLDGRLDAGVHSIEWDGRGASGRSLAPAVYFARLEAGGTDARARVVVVSR